MLSKPSVSKGKFTLDPNGSVGNVVNGTFAYLLSKAPREIVAVKATAQGGAIAGHIYDTNNVGSLDTSQSIPFSSESSNSDNFTPAQPIPMFKGIYIVIEQGYLQNGTVTVLYN